jgi:hypothetical protein
MFRRTCRELRALPRPRNTAELEALSAWYFGVALHIRSLRVNGCGGWYEIDESYDSYNRAPKAAWKGPTADGSKPYDNSGYDYSRDFWQHIFGRLGTGGTARASYGDFKSERAGHREALRLASLQDSWRRKDAGRVRKSLARLAPNGGGGESGGIRGSATLTLGREDGAEAAFIASAMSTGTAKTPKAVEGRSPASAVGAAETPKQGCP